MRTGPSPPPPAQATTDVMLLRIRHASFLAMTLAVPVFITGIFSYVVGAVAAVVAFVGALVTFHRAERSDLFAYGVVPCFGGLCGCDPYVELHTARLTLAFAAFVSAASCVIALVAIFAANPSDWVVAMRVTCAALSFLLALACLAALAALQMALSYGPADFVTPPRQPPTAAWTRDPFHLSPFADVPNVRNSPPRWSEPEAAGRRHWEDRSGTQDNGWYR